MNDNEINHAQELEKLVTPKSDFSNHANTNEFVQIPMQTFFQPFQAIYAMAWAKARAEIKRTSKFVATPGSLSCFWRN